jgi:DNA-binding CsgD family transcriptional regulator
MMLGRGAWGLDLYLFKTLHAARDATALCAAANKISIELGFKHFFHGMRMAASLAETSEFSLDGFPQAWLNHYSTHRYHRVDPLVDHCSRKIVPIAWDERFFVKPAAAKLYEEAREFGISRGVTIPLHSPGVEVALLTLVFHDQQRITNDDCFAAIGKGQLFACHLHEAIKKMALVQKHSGLGVKPLTEREKQCLLWAAGGKTSWEISQILNITERTVIFHMANAAEKVGAVNRRQAVARAIVMGLINP